MFWPRREEIGQRPNMQQLKALIDICHLYGIAFIVDVVYNHAGGDFDSQSINYFDFPVVCDEHTSIYFSEHNWSSGRMFDYNKPEVCRFLIGNVLMFHREYHADGFRFDEVSAIDLRDGSDGWSFCQKLTKEPNQEDKRRVKIAEYWNNNDGTRYRHLAVIDPPNGMGFDIDQFRDIVRNLIGKAAGGRTKYVPISALRTALEYVPYYSEHFRAYNCVENHDLILDADGDKHRLPRIAKLAHWDDPRSPFARGRARVATGLLLTGTGVPMIFMGQEFLEDKLWSDNPHLRNRQIWWDGLDGADQHMVDFRQFTRELIWLRRKHPALARRRTERVSL